MHRKQTGAPLLLFYSYAHEDEALQKQLETHLALLRREGFISEWHNRQIVAGADWKLEVDAHLETASIILLLISSDFLASDYCYSVEMQRALQHHSQGKAHVIPIFLRPVDWKHAPFAHLQGLPSDGKSVTEWENQDAAFREVVRAIRRVIEQPPFPVLSSVARQNRLRMLKRVQQTWIEGVLEHSLHQATLIALGLQERPDALANPWHLEVQETKQPPQPLPAGTSIVEVYDDADGELLILGEPGSGKTTLLLELARTLLARAEKDERARLPVVFNLSSWAQRRQPLGKWLVEELWTKYQVPRMVGRGWLDADQIFPLLDGLDEVAKDARLHCMQAINDYYLHHLEQGFAPLVVCCRSQDYLAIPIRVMMQRAVSIQPLGNEQIEHYLQSAQGQLEGVRYVLGQDSDLAELARRPLMLNIFILAYQGMPLEAFPTEGTLETQQRQVFATYVKRMLTRRGLPHQQMLQWLTFVAVRMKEHQQTVLSLEHIQPYWLVLWKKRLLYRVSVGLLAGSLVGLIGVLLAGLFFADYGSLFGQPQNSSWVQEIPGDIIGHLQVSVEMLHFGQLIEGLIGLSFGLFSGLSQIHFRERLAWSWRITRWNIIAGLLVGLLTWVFTALRVLEAQQFIPMPPGVHVEIELPNPLLKALPFGLVAAFLVGLASRFTANQLDNREELLPNQGIWRSAQNGLLVGLFYGLPAGLFTGLIAGPAVEPTAEWLIGPAVGPLYGLLYGILIGLPTMLLVGLTAGLFFGLGAFSQHFTLRFWLWCMRCLPWNLVAFLDEATNRLLLRKVGGGYIFIHRLLLDYFASLEKKDS